MKKIVPVFILLILGGIAFLVIRNPPEVDRRPPVAGPQMTVDVMSIEQQPYHVRLESYGTVKPQIQSMLVAQVSGEITKISDSLRGGGFFEKDDVLLSIDDRDYLADVKIAEATLLDARQALAQEQARALQAQQDWDRLGQKGEPGDLVLRKPQLLAAQARLISAQSTLEKARLDLERTKITAPYAGRVMKKMVDLGQVVTVNSQVAEVYAVDKVEIRLPLRNRDLSFIDLPEDYRFELAQSTAGPQVTIFSELAGGSRWQGRVVRTESAIDDNARQLHVVAQIDDPYGQQAKGKTPLKIGQYVTAVLSGRNLSKAIVIPNKAIYQGSYVYLVTDGVLKRQEIQIAWQNRNQTIIDSGLQPGDKLVLTSLGQVTSGVRVKIANDTAAADLAVSVLESESAGGEEL